MFKSLVPFLFTPLSLEVLFVSCCFDSCPYVSSLFWDNMISRIWNPLKFGPVTLLLFTWMLWNFRLYSLYSSATSHSSAFVPSVSAEACNSNFINYIPYENHTASLVNMLSHGNYSLYPYIAELNSAVLSAVTYCLLPFEYLCNCLGVSTSK